MFSNIKSIFTKSESTPIQNNPQKFDHSNIRASGATQCPFMNKKAHQNGQKNEVKGLNKSEKIKQATEVQSQSQEDEKPRGGCPFMGGSDRKKNPSLPLNNQAFDEPFVSKFKYYLSANKMDFSMKGKGKVHHRSRLMFDQYPIYLQHTIFFSGEDYKKVRGLQCCSRFMAYEQLRQKGNKHYNKGRYYEALQFYERAMSLFRWLQYHQQLNQSKISSEVGLQSCKSIDESSDNNSVNQSKIHIDLQKEGEEMQFKQMTDLKQKYKQFFIIYCDQNIKECNGEELEQAADIDMRKSLLIQIYLNMAAAYINLNHYSLAEQIVNDGIALSQRVSQLYFRKAQSIAMRKDADYQKLIIAQQCINKALEMRPNQKIFTTANINILKMLNLHDAQQAYQACGCLVKERLTEIESKNIEVKNMIYERAVEINKIQKRMIEEGKTPRENLDDKMLNNTTEMKILQRMFKKYVRVLQFYTQAKNKEQVMLAKKEFQQILRIGWEVKTIFEMKIEEKQNELGGLYTDKIEKRVNSIKTRFADQIYNKGRFNFTMLEWVIKEIVKEEAEEQKLRKEEEMQNKVGQTTESTAGEKNGLTKKLPYLLLLLPLLIIMISFFLI